METSKELESAINAVASYTKVYNDLVLQIKATEEARDRAKAYVENCTVQQRPQAEKILESWELTLAEMSDAARYRMTGLGVVEPVARWIAEGIILAEGGAK